MTRSEHCETALHQISLLLDQELPEIQEQSLWSHLALCTHCQQMKEELQKNEEILHDSFPSHLFGSTFDEEILEYLQKQNLYSIPHSKVETTSSKKAISRPPHLLTPINIVLQLTAALLFISLFFFIQALFQHSSEDLPSSPNTYLSSSSLFIQESNYNERIQQGSWLEFSPNSTPLSLHLILSDKLKPIPIEIGGNQDIHKILFRQEVGKRTFEFISSHLQLKLDTNLSILAKKSHFKVSCFHDSIAKASSSSHWPLFPFSPLYAESATPFYKIESYEGGLLFYAHQKSYYLPPKSSVYLNSPYFLEYKKELFPLTNFFSLQSYLKKLTSLKNTLSKYPLSSSPKTSPTTPQIASSLETSEEGILAPEEFLATVEATPLSRSFMYSIKLQWSSVNYRSLPVGFYLYRLQGDQEIQLNKKPLYTLEFTDKKEISAALSDTYYYYIQAVVFHEGKEILSPYAYTDVTVTPHIHFQYQGGDDHQALFMVTLMIDGNLFKQSFTVKESEFIGTSLKNGELNFSTGFLLKKISYETQEFYEKKVPAEKDAKGRILQWKIEKKKLKKPLLLRKVELFNPETKETLVQTLRHK